MTNRQFSENLPNGTRLQGGKYVIEKMLGQDAMGFTYLAQNHDVSHSNVGNGQRDSVLIKEFFLRDIQTRLNAPLVDSTRDFEQVDFYTEQFRKQIRQLRRLEHPYWLRITDFFEENGTLYYVSDYVEAETIREYVHHDVLTEQQVLSIFCDIASVLHEMFRLNLLHMDISHDNILIAKDGHAYVKGFGFSDIYDDGEDKLVGDEPGRSYGFFHLNVYKQKLLQSFQKPILLVLLFIICLQGSFLIWGIC